MAKQWYAATMQRDGSRPHSRVFIGEGIDDAARRATEWGGSYSPPYRMIRIEHVDDAARRQRSEECAG